MKKLLILFVAVTLVSLAAMAAVAQNKGPETVTLPASMGDITFEHSKHQERVADCASCHHAGVETGKCSNCHDANPEAPKAKAVFHKLCKDCHKKEAGPTKCKACHVK